MNDLTMEIIALCLGGAAAGQQLMIWAYRRDNIALVMVAFLAICIGRGAVNVSSHYQHLPPQQEAK